MTKKLLMNNSLTPPIDERIFAEYAFDNTIDSNCLPTLTIVGGYEVIDEVNGNITRRILRNADGNKPTAISFNGKEALLTVDNLVATVTTLGFAFNSCRNMTSANLSNLDTSNLTAMHYMINNCQKLTNLNLSNFNTSKVTGMNYAFYLCINLSSELVIKSPNIGSYANMFNGTSIYPNAKFTVRYTDEATKAMAEN